MEPDPFPSGFLLCLAHTHMPFASLPWFTHTHTLPTHATTFLPCLCLSTHTLPHTPSYYLLHVCLTHVPFLRFLLLLLCLAFSLLPPHLHLPFTSHELPLLPTYLPRFPLHTFADTWDWFRLPTHTVHVQVLCPCCLCPLPFSSDSYH